MERPDVGSRGKVGVGRWQRPYAARWSRATAQKTDTAIACRPNADGDQSEPKCARGRTRTKKGRDPGESRRYVHDRLKLTVAGRPSRLHLARELRECGSDSATYGPPGKIAGQGRFPRLREPAFDLPGAGLGEFREKILLARSLVAPGQETIEHRDRVNAGASSSGTQAPLPTVR